MSSLDTPLDEAMAVLEALGDLEPNWDSYGAPAMDPDTLQRARGILPFFGIFPPAVVPTSLGGVSFEWQERVAHGIAEVSLEFHPNGKTSVYLAGPGYEAGYGR